MIDIHSHILPNIDDGSRNMEESLMMAKEAEKNGFTAIICTSHYIPGAYERTERERQILIDELQNKITERNINIKLYNGTEAYISIDLDKLIEEGKISTLNNSRYILFELPMNSKMIYLDEVVDKLFSINLIPVLAHPERYSYMHKNLNIYSELKKRGILFQSNFGSIIGEYGSKPEKIIKKLLKSNMVDFLSTDAHRCDGYDKLEQILKKLRRIITDKEIELLTKINPKNIIRI